MKRSAIRLGTLLLGVLMIPSLSRAWGDAHRVITQAALEIVPEKERWIAILGRENWDHIGGVGEATGYAGTADIQSEFVRRSWGAYFANDYLLTREVPFLHGYHVPVIEEPEWNRQIAGFVRRALLALRTESPREAAHRVGVLLHFVEDAGATAHAARISPPAHTLLDNTVLLEKIRLPGYTPVLLGENDEAFVAALQAKIAALIERSRPVGNRLRPEAVELAPLYGTLRAGISPHRELFEAIAEAQVEPALDCVKLVADTIHTLMTLGLGKPGAGGTLSGTVTWQEPGFYEGSAAEIHLLDTSRVRSATMSPAELFAACAGFDTHTDELGRYSFHHLPPGEYRVLAYRVGSGLAVSDPVSVGEAGPVTKDLDLAPASIAGNLVYNPEMRLSTQVKGQPDRWMELAPLEDGRRAFMNAPVPLSGKRTLRIGVTLRNPAAKVEFFVLPRSRKAAIQDCSRTLRIDPAFATAAEFTGRGGEARVPSETEGGTFVLLHVTGPGSLGDLVEKVWVVPEESP